MSSFANKGLRKHKLNQRKEALFALNNFADIMINMGRLAELIEDHSGLVNDSTILNIANDYNKLNKLNLSEQQINIVINKFL